MQREGNALVQPKILGVFVGRPLADALTLASELPTSDSDCTVPAKSGGVFHVANQRPKFSVYR